MKVLTLTQPWASGVALEIKHWETRSWSTGYRGTLVIHAAKSFPAAAKTFAQAEHAFGRLTDDALPLGAVIAVAKLANVWRSDEVALVTTAVERLWGDFTPGRYVWQLLNVVRLKPIPWRGQLGLWQAPPELEALIRQQLQAKSEV